MDNIKVGNFISELRKSKNLTQKELADKLDLSDKAVSKWERGLGYPDITYLVSLAKILEVSTNELLQGEKETHLTNEVKHKKKVKLNNPNFLISLISGIFIIAALVCLICDFAINKTLTWSIICISSIAFSWLLIIPLLYYKENRIKNSLLSLNIFILPLLFIIEKYSNNGSWFLPVALPVTLISLIYIWIIYYLYLHTKINRWYVSGIAVLLTPIINFISNISVNSFTNNAQNNYSFFNAICCFIIFLVFILIGCITKEKELNK